jgi:hypothetical protein
MTNQGILCIGSRVDMVSPWGNHFYDLCSRAASARTSDPGASIGQVLGRTIQMRERISRRSRCRRSKCCEPLLKCCEELFPCCEPSCSQHSTRDVEINVASLCVACCEQQSVQHPTSEVFLPLLPPCCDYIVTMLRLMSRATSKHQEPSSPPPPWHNTQHYMSATSKLNIRNIAKSLWAWEHPKPSPREGEHHLSGKSSGFHCNNVRSTEQHLKNSLQHTRKIAETLQHSEESLATYTNNSWNNWH